MSRRSQYPARLLSVSQQEDGLYHVRVRFSLYAVQCVLFQELSFTQPSWPAVLQCVVNQEIKGPFMVSCDWTQIQTETEEVRDGSEWLTATVGLKGSTTVLGPVHTETSFTAQYLTQNCIKVWFSDQTHQIYKDLVPDQDRLFYFRSLRGRKVYRDRACKHSIPITPFHRSILHELQKINPTYSKQTKRNAYRAHYYLSINLNEFEQFYPYALSYFQNYLKDRSYTLTSSSFYVINACQSAFLEGYTKGYFQPNSDGESWIYTPNQGQSMFCDPEVADYLNLLRNRPLDVSVDQWDEHLGTLTSFSSFFNYEEYDDEGWPT